MEILIYISIFIFQIGVKVFGDWWYKKNKKKIISHFWSAVIDGTIYLVSAYFLFCYPDWCVWFMIGISLISIGCRWNIYDLVYNWINKHKWNHYGKSAWQDRQLKKLGKWHLAPKIALLILGIIILWKQHFGF